MHVHLDPLGGISGDMFAAAILDARPELRAELASMIESSGLAELVDVHLHKARSRGLAGTRVEVAARPAGDAHHRHHGEVRELISGLELPDTVRERALAITALLARAESRVHDVDEANVAFHEVGAWDSIADLVIAAWLVEQFPGASWSCSALPLGAGRIDTAHGPLPVPAPATALLLEGLPVVDDGVPGERVTPTGAAIVRYLEPAVGPPTGALRISSSGTGCGTRDLGTMANILRALVLDEATPAWDSERIAVLEFEVDDQSPEDLAVALERLRGVDGVVDVTQALAYGKKGRLGMQVRVLATPGVVEPVLERCFVETSTLGVRWHVAARAALRREHAARDVDGAEVRVKRALRPDAVMTAKAEMDDLADAEGGRAGRERLRRAAEEEVSR